LSIIHSPSGATLIIPTNLGERIAAGWVSVSFLRQEHRLFQRRVKMAVDPQPPSIPVIPVGAQGRQVVMDRVKDDAAADRAASHS
jgi:hypothetical protein